MLRTERSAGTVIVAACLFIMWSVAPRAQDAPAGVKASPADVGAVKISGAWQLNKALSTAPPEKAAAPPSGNSGGSAGGRGGRGTGGGNNSTSKNNGLSQAQMSLIAALNGEMRDMPDRLAIHATATDAIITFADGAMRKLTTDGKKQRMTLGAVPTEPIKHVYDHVK